MSQFTLADPKRVGLRLPPGSSMSRDGITNENLQRDLVVISLTKQEMDALNALQNHFIANEDCEFALIGNTETVEGDTGYVGNLIKGETVKHYSHESQHALGYKNYSELPQHLKNAVNAINNLKIRGSVPDADEKMVQMLHVVACIKPSVARDLIINEFGNSIVFNYKNQNIIIKMYETEKNIWRLLAKLGTLGIVTK
jgi:hypothetical protein